MSRIKAFLKDNKRAFIYVAIIILILTSTFMVRQHIFSLIYVSGASMEPTLTDGDMAFGFVVKNPDEIKIGDIVVFDFDGKRYIKRVAEGAGYIYRIGDSDEEAVVGENEFFMLGDNRDNSLDSREFGPIDKSCIKYKVGASFKSAYIFFTVTSIVCIGIVVYFVCLAMSPKNNEQPDKEKDDAEGF